MLSLPWQYALLPVEVLSLQQMLDFGKQALSDSGLVLKSARHVQRELPKRLARRLMDLQLLPYIVVTNPYIRKVRLRQCACTRRNATAVCMQSRGDLARKVYDAYWHAFNTVRSMAPVHTADDNAAFNAVLQRLVDEHGAC